jgi:hypothetical protein
MLRRVIQDERRHFAFYRAQAKARLTRAPRRTRKAVRWMLETLWTPVGAGAKSEEEVDSLVLYLFGDSDEGRQGVREVDAMVQELPGLEGLALGEDYLEGAIGRARSRPGWGGVIPQPDPERALRGAASEAWGPPREAARA